jgi:hypothetical protein
LIALALSALLAVYLLIPNALFRFLLGSFVPVRVFQGVKAEEITRAVVTLIFLFGFAVLLVWYIPGSRSWPCGFSDTVEQKYADYTLVAGGLYSEAVFKESQQNFWSAFSRTLKRQARFVFWYYLCVVLAAWGLGVLSKRYGKMKRNHFYSVFADFYLLPHISQWYAILTGFTFPDKTTVRADVLMTDDTLYSGEVADYFLGADGSLTGLFLRNPKRFDRPRYLKERAEWGVTRSIEKFWRPIPSAKLYLIGSQIVNLNLNYEPSSASTDVLNKYIAEYLKGPVRMTVTVNEPTVTDVSPFGKQEHKGQ